VGWGGAAAAADATHWSGLHTVLPRGSGADALFPHFDTGCARLVFFGSVAKVIEARLPGAATAAADDTHRSGLHTVLPRGSGADALFPHFDTG